MFVTGVRGEPVLHTISIQLRFSSMLGLFAYSLTRVTCGDLSLCALGFLFSFFYDYNMSISIFNGELVTFDHQTCVVSYG